MVNHILLYLGAFFTFVWGVSHLFPTKSVVAGFGQISQDNKRIITMEWIIEGVSLIFIGLLVAVVTWLDVGQFALRVVCWICFAESWLVSSLG